MKSRLWYILTCALLLSCSHVNLTKAPRLAVDPEIETLILRELILISGGRTISKDVVFIRASPGVQARLIAEFSGRTPRVVSCSEARIGKLVRQRGTRVEGAMVGLSGVLSGHIDESWLQLYGVKRDDIDMLVFGYIYTGEAAIVRYHFLLKNRDGKWRIVSVRRGLIT